MKRVARLALVAIGLAGCSAIPLQPGAEMVRVTNEEPKGCKFLGDVTGNQGNFFTGDFTFDRLRARLAPGWCRRLRTRRTDCRFDRVTARPILLAAQQLQPAIQTRRLAAQTHRARYVLLRSAFE